MWHLRYYKTNEQYLEDVENEKIRLPYVIYNEETDKASWGRYFGDIPAGTMLLNYELRAFTVRFQDDFVEEVLGGWATGATFVYSEKRIVQGEEVVSWFEGGIGLEVLTEKPCPSVGDTVYYPMYGEGGLEGGLPCGTVIPLDFTICNYGFEISGPVVLAIENGSPDQVESVTANGKEILPLPLEIDDGGEPPYLWCIDPSDIPADGKVEVKCVLKNGDLSDGITCGIHGTGLGLTSAILGEGISRIPDYSFCENPTLSAVTFPSTLKEIGDGAFKGHDLSNIILPEGLEMIGEDAFAFDGEVGACEKVVIPSTITSIGGGAFDYLCGTSEDGLISPEDFINNSPLDAEEYGYWGAWVGDSMLYGSICILNNKAVTCGWGMPASEMYEIPNNITGATSFSLSCLRNAGGAPDGSRWVINITLHDTLVDVSDYAFGDEKVYNPSNYYIYLDSTALLDKLWVFEGANIYIAGEYAGTLTAGSINNGYGGYDSYGNSYGDSSYGSYGGPA